MNIDEAIELGKLTLEDGENPASWRQQVLVAEAFLAVTNDPTELLPEMVWRENGGPATARTAIDTYAVWLYRSKWLWRFGDDEPTPCDSLESGKAACRDHLRGKVRELFGVKK